MQPKIVVRLGCLQDVHHVRFHGHDSSVRYLQSCDLVGDSRDDKAWAGGVSDELPGAAGQDGRIYGKRRESGLLAGGLATLLRHAFRHHDAHRRAPGVLGAGLSDPDARRQVDPVLPAPFSRSGRRHRGLGQHPLGAELLVHPQRRRTARRATRRHRHDRAGVCDAGAGAGDPEEWSGRQGALLLHFAEHIHGPQARLRLRRQRHHGRHAHRTHAPGAAARPDLRPAAQRVPRGDQVAGLHGPREERLSPGASAHARPPHACAAGLVRASSGSHAGACICVPPTPLIRGAFQ
mmetsp:Transcript_18139/g.58819  ORF Transcript_18139/g.58819 Transcript_18139/m.58819 type:complete len:292 (-) Transcript_18139:26-901(-)